MTNFQERLLERTDTLETRLASQRYLFGARVVESDWRLFVTLIRFDAVYHGHLGNHRSHSGTCHPTFLLAQP